MTVSSVYNSVNATSGASSTDTASKVGKGMGSLGATDFLKLLTTQMTNQDPTAPMDNQDMLAQMAQFTSLSNTTETAAATAEMASTLKAIAAKLGVSLPSDDDDSAKTQTDTTGTTPNVAA